jgi:prepilin-type N-terminal cleavage/methylation domain-containing protein
MKYLKNEKGFTLLELLISTTVFSVILLLCTFGLIQVGRNYYRGNTISRTQNATRSAMNTLTQSIQFSGSPPQGTLPAASSSPPQSGIFCIGSLRYDYKLKTQVKDSINENYALKTSRIDNAADCNSGSSGPQTELLGKGMSLREFSIVENGSDYTITMLVAYGDDDLLNDNGLCKGGAGSQFCATSSLKTTVHRRLK